ncbi:MAG: NAD-dependent protein deacylase [Oscillospiraceae bacterium]|jgi:NAD-dependent deacetylase|nr:NAD-dependent protein deacylase [Oscillospiraceae bacterium]
MEHEKIAQLRQWVGESQRIVFFGGAGVSTESGIPDFRSTDGLYSQSYDFPPETILSRSFFDARPAEFYRFYRDKMLCLDAKPNRSHRVLARWEKEGKLSAVVTQNIDGLHQAAGSERVYELHGSIHRNRCMRCGKAFPVSFIAQGTDIPYCSCGGIVKPDVVLYEEGLDSSTLRGAADAIRSADLLLVGGTSLAVYPAAGLLQYYQGKRLVLINKSPTPADGRADLLLPGLLGNILSAAAGLEPEEDN